jgi:hypothetical protein
MSIGDLSDFFCNEFSAIIGSDGEGFVSANMLKVNLGVCFESVTFACLLKSVGSSKHAVRARGDFGFLASSLDTFSFVSNLWICGEFDKLTVLLVDPSAVGGIKTEFDACHSPLRSSITVTAWVS